MRKIKLIDGSSGVNPLGPSRKIKAAVRKALKGIGNSPSADPGVLSGFFQSKFGLSPENVLFANSLKELVYMVPEVFCPRKVLIVGPAVEMYADAAQSAGAEVCYVHAREAEGFAPDISSIMKDIRNTDMVFLSNPGRISGKMLSLRELGEILSASADKSPHFVIDEAMMEFTGLYDHHVDKPFLEHCTILRTTAFFYGMPGLELAYAVSSSGTIQQYNKKRRWSINHLSSEAARVAYQDSTFRRLSKEYLRVEKQMVMRALSKIGWIKVYDTDTSTMLMKTDASPDKVGHMLRRSGLQIENCGDIKGLDRSFLRVSLMKHEHNLKLITALKNMDRSQ